MPDLFKINNPKKVFSATKLFIESIGFGVIDHDFDRPWGGYFVINEKQSYTFIEHFFPEQNADEFEGYSKLSPKILLVAPGKRLSWQYHHRRAEIWKVIEGEAGIIRSQTNEQGEIETFSEGEFIQLKQGERHRLVGLTGWAAIAEIWKHTDPDNPSDENDIVRLLDDFGRK